MREGSRGLGTGEESHDEVCPSETANALPRDILCIVRLNSGLVGCSRCAFAFLLLYKVGVSTHTFLQGCLRIGGDGETAILHPCMHLLREARAVSLCCL